MSTTITYKGDTIATLSNNTKTLKTSGKYLEDDITVTESIPSGSATTPATTITANPSISVSSGGLITATASATQSVTPTVSEGYISSGTAGTITVSGSNTSQLSVQAAKTITPTESEQTAVASGKYTTGVVKVGAISSTYVGSGISQNDSDDLTANGATVTAPAGYYAEAASKSVASMTLPTAAAASATSGFTSKATISRSTSDQYINIPTGYNSAGAYYKVSAVANGTAGTPIVIEGAISNHQITITPSVINTEGYISGGTKTGAVITVKASDLVSGTKSITSTGTTDVTNYAEVSVPDLILPLSADSSSNGGYKKATIGRSTSTQYINLPSGFNNSNAYYEISAVANGSVTAPSSISATGATVTAGTNTLTLSKTVSNTPNVTTAGYISSGTAGNSSVSLTASVNTRSSSDLSASGATVTAPAGYYAETATKSVASGSATTPRTEVDPAMHISVSSTGLITALTQETVNVTPSIEAGYVSEGTSGLILVNGSKTKQLTTQDTTVGEPDATGDILAGLTTQYYYTMRAIDLVSGQWSYNTPIDTPTTRARSKDFVYVTAGSSISYVNNSYDCYFQVYGSKTSSTISQNIGWKTDASGTINITVNGYLTFIVRNHYNTSATVNPALWDGSVVITYAGSHNGVYWTWEGSNTCVVSGACNSSNGAVSNLITNTAIPSSIIPGDTYYVTFNSSPAQSNARFRILFYDSNGDMLTPTYYFTGSRYFVVPTGATNWTVGLHSANVTYSSNVTLTGMRIYAVKKIVDAGTYVTGDIYVRAY